METGDLEPAATDVIRRSYLAWVTMQHRQAEAATENRIHAISEARQWGATWEEIGDAMSMSRQSAHKRYARLVDDDPHAADEVAS